MPARSASEYLELADNIVLHKTLFSPEREGRTRQLLKAAEIAAKLQHAIGVQYASEAEGRMWRHFLRTGEKRDMSEGSGAYLGSSGSSLVPIGFRNATIEALRQMDSLWDPTLVTVVKTEKGAAFNLPLDSDVLNAAIALDENALDVSIADPTMGLLALGQATTYRASTYVSMELRQDSGIDIDAFLAARFAIRFERAFGAAMVAALLSGTSTTVTALGAGASGQSMTVNKVAGKTAANNSIGSDDLYALTESLDAAYSSRAAWAMHPDTFKAVMSLRTGGTTGLKVFHEAFDSDGHPLLMGRRVAFCPSMDQIGADARVVVCVGDFSRVIVREVVGKPGSPTGEGMSMELSFQKRPEYGQVFYRAIWRLQAACAIDSTLSPSDQPFVGLSCG